MAPVVRSVAHAGGVPGCVVHDVPIPELPDACSNEVPGAHSLLPEES